jgi:orotidine-5'-phosphate decarboxylase
MKIIVSLDVESVIDARPIVDAFKNDNRVAGYKIGFMLGLTGLEHAVNLIRSRDYGKSLIIYDHQKGGTDIPDMGTKFAHIMHKCGVDAAILFPLTGPATLEAWYKALTEEDIATIVGGYMTHPKFSLDEGGYVANNAAEWSIYKFALELGVRNFVMPGNKIEITKKILNLVRDKMPTDSNQHFINVFSPGIKTQGGDIQDLLHIMNGVEFFPIVGRAIYEAKDPMTALNELIPCNPGNEITFRSERCPICWSDVILSEGSYACQRCDWGHA